MVEGSEGKLHLPVEWRMLSPQEVCVIFGVAGHAHSRATVPIASLAVTWILLPAIIIILFFCSSPLNSLFDFECI